MPIMIISHREREILNFLSHGYKRKEVAQLISLSQYTVDDHIKHMQHKLGATNTAQLIRIGFEEGLLEIFPHKSIA